jgi:hypothetical protein
MANRKVTLKMRITENGKRKYVPAAFEKGKIKSGWAMIGKTATERKDGVYCLRYMKNGKRKYDTIKGGAAEAIVALRKKQAAMAAVAEGLEVAEERQEPKQITSNKVVEIRPAAGTPQHGNEPLMVTPAVTNGRPLKEAVEKYLKDTQAGGTHNTWLNYNLALNYFLECCKKEFVEQLDRETSCTSLTRSNATRNHSSKATSRCPPEPFGTTSRSSEPSCSPTA